MLNNKKVLCLGNNTKNTDALATKYANENNSINYGLIDDVSHEINKVGFYHTSISDIGKEGALQLAKQFDHVLIFDQTIESYETEELYHKTRHAGILIKNRYKITTDIVDAKAE